MAATRTARPARPHTKAVANQRVLTNAQWTTLQRCARQFDQILAQIGRVQGQKQQPARGKTMAVGTVA